MSFKESTQYYHAPDLHGLSLLNASFKQQQFSRHVHEEYCIGVIEQGAQRFFRSGANHIAAQNGIILVNPDQIHDGHAATESGWKYRAMYPMPSLVQTIQDELFPHLTGTATFKQPVVDDLYLANQLRQLFNILQYSDNSLQRETSFMAVISALLTRHANHQVKPAQTSKNTPAIHLVREYIDAHFADNIQLKDLANLVNLNPFYLTRIFQKQLGLPPHAYQIQRRLHHAKQLLLAGHSLLETALTCGFSDQSHLNLHFKKWLGVPPGKFQQTVSRKQS